MAAPQSVRLHQLVRRMFSLKESYDADVPESFMPVVQVSHEYEIDRLRLGDVHLWSVGNTRPASVGNRSLITIAAPAGVLVACKRFFLGGGATNKTWRFVWNLNTVTPRVSSVFPQHLDSRGSRITPGVAAAPAAPIVVEADTAAALPGPMIFQALAAAGITAVWDVDLLIWGGPVSSTFAGNWELQLWSEAVNDASTYSIFGYHRSLEPSEQY